MPLRTGGAQAAHNRARRPNPAHPRKRRWQTLLHHFDLSPFSEKVRLVLGAKGFDWQSVTVPMVLPKPAVVALTGGCRRTPFLQMGADIYCDTALICRVIDALAPHPALYPAHNRGLAEIVAQWADASLFWIAVPFMSQQVSMPYLFPGASEQTIQSLFADRAAMAPHIRCATIADGEAQLQIYLARLDHMLANGGPFLLGEAPCIADFSVVHSLWYMHRSPPIAGLVDPHVHLRAWYGRMFAFGHGQSRTLHSADAIAVAAATPGHAPARVEPARGFVAGQVVRVTPGDYAQDPVTGRLVGLAPDEIALAREDPRAGRMHVHFPRIGYRVETDPPAKG